MSKFSYQVFRAIVARSGLTGRQLAKKMGVDPNTVSRWMQGKYAPRDFAKLADVLGVNVEDFLEHNETQQSFSDDLDVIITYEFNSYGITSLYQDGRLLWKTTNENYLADRRTAKRTFVVSGKIGHYLLTALAKGLHEMQDESEFVTI